MDIIPTFSGILMDVDYGLTCGQFISLIEDHLQTYELTDYQIKDLCLSKLSDRALELFQKNIDKSWCDLKTLMFEHFPIKLTIKEKVEVRKKLKQHDHETIDDFYQRCVKSQYLISDDFKDVSFEREVLLHFLIGLNSCIRDVVLATKCWTVDDYINEAKKHCHRIKAEPVEHIDPFEPKVEIEFDSFDVNNSMEFDVHEEYFEEHVYENTKPKKAHLKNIHIEKKQSFICGECGKSLSTKKILKKHYKNMHADKYLKAQELKNTHMEKEQSVICDDCGATLSSKKTLRKHYISQHADATEKAKHFIKCTHPDCDYSTLSKPSLNRHVKSVHLKEKNFQCSFCPKRFFAKKMCEEHTNGVHLNIKNLKCDKCEYETAYSSPFNEHQKVAHGNQKYDCPYCNHSAKYKGNLDKHINNVHKNLLAILAVDDNTSAHESGLFG